MSSAFRPAAPTPAIHIGRTQRPIVSVLSHVAQANDNERNIVFASEQEAFAQATVQPGSTRRAAALRMPTASLLPSAEPRLQALAMGASLPPPPPPPDALLQAPSACPPSNLPTYFSPWRLWVICGAIASLLGAAAIGVGRSWPSVLLQGSGTVLLLGGLAAIAYGLWLRYQQEPKVLLQRFVPQSHQGDLQRSLERGGGGAWRAAMDAIACVPLAERADVVRNACQYFENSSLSLADCIHGFRLCSGRRQLLQVLQRESLFDLSFSALSRVALIEPQHYQPYLQRLLSGFVHRRLDDALSGLRVTRHRVATTTLHEVNEMTNQVDDTHFVDNENVMDSDRIERSRQLIVAFEQYYASTFAHAPKRSKDVALAVGQITEYLHRNRDKFTAKQRANIQRVLYLPSRSGDFSRPLVTNPPFALPNGRSTGLGILTSQIWEVIATKLTEGNTGRREGELMAHTFLCNLADCIESDGHYVCSVGVTQRLLTTLGGYVKGLPSLEPITPTIHEVLNHLSQSFQSYGDEQPSQQHLQLFSERAQREALRIWPGAHFAKTRAEFLTLLQDFLQLSYDFVTEST